MSMSGIVRGWRSCADAEGARVCPPGAGHRERRSSSPRSARNTPPLTQVSVA